MSERRDLEVIADLVPPGSRVLDLGCGDGELLAHLIDSDGEVCDYELNARLVAMSPAELDAIPFTIGVAAGPNKVAPICAALRGRHVKAMALDEATANGVLRMMGK